MCDFESYQCPFDEAEDKDKLPKWTRMKANTIGNGTFSDHTTGSGMVCNKKCFVSHLHCGMPLNMKRRSEYRL